MRNRMIPLVIGGLSLLGSGGAALAQSASNVEVPKPIFSQGTQALTLSAGYGYPILGDSEYYITPGLAYSWYVFDGFAISPEVRGHYADTEEEDTVGGDFSLMARWHFVRVERWSLFADLGAGVSYFDHRLPPPDGTRFNFVLRGGVGATYQIKEDCHLIGGVRVEHFSNAGLQGADRHPGSNALEAYIGVMWTF